MTGHYVALYCLFCIWLAHWQWFGQLVHCVSAPCSRCFATLLVIPFCWEKERKKVCLQNGMIGEINQLLEGDKVGINFTVVPHPININHAGRGSRSLMTRAPVSRTSKRPLLRFRGEKIRIGFCVLGASRVCVNSCGVLPACDGNRETNQGSAIFPLSSFVFVIFESHSRITNCSWYLVTNTSLPEARVVFNGQRAERSFSFVIIAFGRSFFWWFQRSITIAKDVIWRNPLRAYVSR